MCKLPTFLAIIPAREGTKRLPGKNIKKLLKKPLIQWTIDAALQSQYINNTIVSTDNDAVIKITQETKGIKALERPASLASDTARMVDVVKHALENSMLKYDYVVLLQPTSPLRTGIHIDQAIELLIEKKADAVISVCEMNHSPLWSNNLPANNSMAGFLRREIINKSSQELEKYYRLNGAIYICKTDKLISENTLFLRKNIFAYIMPRRQSIDIDDDLDLNLAEIIMKETVFRSNKQRGNKGN
jgi:CMP-N-acetylneuraminic acid synthetase